MAMSESGQTNPAVAALPYTRGCFQSSDKYQWIFHRWIPEAKPIAHIVFLHGIQSHAGWYVESCEFLRRHGYLLTFIDRRGSGQNNRGRGDSPNFLRLLDDVGEFIQYERMATDGEAGLPLILAGISWGAKIAVGTLHRWPGLIDAVILICPGIRPKIGLNFLQKAAILWANIWAPRHKFTIPLTDPELFTENPFWQDYLRKDALSLRRATARFLCGSAFLDAYLKRTHAVAMPPLLVLLAGKDKIIDNDQTRTWVSGWPSPCRSIIEYPDAAHTLEFEPDRVNFRADLLSWIETTVLGGKSQS